MTDRDESRRESNAPPWRLAVYFREFVSQPPSPRTARHLSLLSSARAEWRQSWESIREASSADGARSRGLLELLPHAKSALVSGQRGWFHPIAEETDEVDKWHASWRELKAEESSRLVQRLLHFLERVSGEAGAPAFDELQRSLPRAGMPPAVLTPMLSALAPERFVSIHRHSLRVVSLITGLPLRNDIAAYPDANRAVLAWLEGMTLDGSSPLGERPQADRFESFCRWLLHEKRVRLDQGSFAVSRDMYKDWPPMW